MSFRNRLLVFFLPVTLLPLLALAGLIRHEMTTQMTGLYRQRVTAAAAVVHEDVVRQGHRIDRSLKHLERSLADDNQFRRAAVDGDPSARRYLLDYAGSAMGLMGLDALQIQDEAGRILSSGHFRNEYNRQEKRLPELLSDVAGAQAILVSMRSPAGPFLAFARVESFRMGGHQFALIGGMRVESTFLSRLERGEDLTVRLVYPDGIMTADTVQTDIPGASPAVPDAALIREVTLPIIGPERGGVATARLQISHARTALLTLHRWLDRWFVIVGVVAVALSVGIISILAANISRPLEALAQKTARLNMERLDLNFESDRTDEIGRLARFLVDMTGRLRAGALKIRDAERRATVGELARQVNHDIKNGLVPVRNVFRHLAEIAGSEPDRVPEILLERRETIEAGFAYLENLAAHYARLSPAVVRTRIELNDLVRRAARDFGDGGDVRLRIDLAESTPIEGDPVAVRRILENLVANARESFDGKPGLITLATRTATDAAGRRVVRLIVEDGGCGMTAEQQAHLFDDFYTTKPGGTGLGLSIVRRLVMDLEGRIRVKSAPGAGSCFSIDLPLATDVDG